MKLIRKQYRIVTLGVCTAKIDFKKIKEIDKKLVTQNASICKGIRIESIFWMSPMNKNRQTILLVIEVDDAKMTNPLIEEG